MAAGVEDGIVIFLFDAIEANRRGELCIRGHISFKAAGKVGLKFRFVAFRIERRLTAFRRGEHDLGAGVLKHEIRRRQFLEPEAGLSAGVAELVVRGENHQDLHDEVLSVASCVAVAYPLSDLGPLTNGLFGR